MGYFDIASLWVGRCIFVAAAIGGAAAVVGCFNAAAGIIFWGYARKVGFTVRNWEHVTLWVKSGKPQWKMGEDHVYRQVPTAAPASYVGDGEEDNER